MKYLIFVCIVLHCNTFAQFYSDFDNNDLSEWIMYPANQWGIEFINDNGWLKHSFNSSESGVSTIYRYINTDLSAAPTLWQFKLKHAYNPSSTNNWIIYFVSNMPVNEINQHLISGYGIGINFNSSDDTLTLYRFDEGKSIAIKKLNLNSAN